MEGALSPFFVFLAMAIPEKGIQIIKATDKFIDRETELLVDGLKPLERAMVAAIMNRVNELTGKTAISDTKANAQKIAALRNDLIRIIRESKWKARGNRFLKSFDSLIDFGIDVNGAINGATVNKTVLQNVKNIALNKYEDLLFQEGFESAVINPAIRHLEELVATGADFSTIRAEVVGFAEGNQGVVRYGSQIAQDAMAQFTGAINTKIGNELGLQWVSYSGSIIVTSRAQCRRWTQFRFLHKSELQKEIDWAFRNGSGEINPTTPATFVINRGGWRCRHFAVWVSDAVVPDSAFARVGITKPD